MNRKILLSSVSPTHKPTAIVERVKYGKDKKTSILSIAIDGTVKTGCVIVADTSEQKNLAKALEKDSVHMVEVQFHRLRLYKHDDNKVQGYADSYIILDDA